MDTRCCCSFLVLAAFAVGSVGAGGFPDCNDNGLDDTEETATSFTEIVVQSFIVYRCQLADIDADGDLDLLGSSSLTWRENVDGSGTFGPQQSIVPGVGGSPVPADFDGDGDLDLLAGHDWVEPWGKAISIYENTGGGNFSLLDRYFPFCSDEPNTHFWSAGPTVGDRDSDGDLDASTPMLICSALVSLTGWNDNGSWSWQEDNVWSGLIGDLAIGDIDGDFDSDFAGTSWGFTWFEGPDETIEHVQPYGDGMFLWDFDLVDVNGDGDLDAMGHRHECAQCSPQVTEFVVFENASGPGTFEWGQVIASHPDEEAPSRPPFATGDLDGDGDQDVVWHDTPYGRVLWSLNDSGTFGPPQAPLGQLIGTTHPMSFDIGDIDGDGDQDILAPYFGEVNGRIVWFRNDGDDCDGDRVPDECQADCNGNGIADPCDIRGGFSIDCNGNGTPDECDAPCGGPCDSDGDGCRDAVDAAPDDATACGDTDADGCDDCSNGAYAPSTDGANSDTDGVCDLTDCDPSNNEVWGEPGAASGLTLARQDPATGLSWDPPATAGGVSVRYDLLRSPIASDFLSVATTACIEPDDDDAIATDNDVPASNELFHYLVRVENDCPLGAGSLGTDSGGVPRVGRACDGVIGGSR